MGQPRCSVCNLTRELAEFNSTDLHGMLGLVFRYVMTAFGVDAVDILFYEGQPPVLKTTGGEGFRSSTFSASSVHGQMMSATLKGQKLVHIPDLGKTEWGRVRELVMESFVTHVGVPLLLGTRVVGLLEIYHRRSLGVNSGWLARLSEVTDQLTPALARALEIRELRRTNADLGAVADAIAERWALSLEQRGLEPKGHTARVAELTVELCRALGAAESDIVHIRRGALLHDIGRVGIPDQVQQKSLLLEEDDYDVVRLHPLTAYDLLEPIPALHPARSIPLCHHEKWDGTGYPRGLKGEEIPYEARVFAIVDTYDVLHSDFANRKAWPEAKILALIRSRGAYQFDPKLAETFAKLVESGKMLKRKPGGGKDESREYLMTQIKV
jgi:response regulator RpfG family c-di-GMP phosphodiesterase